MKTLFLLLFLVTTNAFAGVAAECQLTEGIYKNSSLSLTDMKFETVVDIFTLNNARTISMNLNGESMRFTRMDMEINRNTKLIYNLKKKNKISRVIHLNIDRTPKNVSRDREFYGNMIITEELKDKMSITDLATANKFVYNFYCRF
jgi:NAD-dependent SIR2 family protein deacetylase